MAGGADGDSHLLEDESVPRAPESTWFAQLVGWACLLFYQLPSILRMTELRNPFLCSCVVGTCGARKPCSVVLVLLDD